MVFTKQKKSVFDKVFISENSHEDLVILNSIKNPPSVIKVLSWEVIASMIEEGMGAGVTKLCSQTSWL